MALDFYNVLVVDDNPGEAELAGERLSEAPGCNFEVRNAVSLAEALAAIESVPPDAVILDLNLPDSRGLDTLREVRRAAPGTALIVVSGMVDDALRAQALRDGAEDVLSKDEAGGRLFFRSVLYVIERQRARLQHRQLEQLLDATPDAMLAVNARGEVRFVNSAALALLGRSREALLSERLVLSVEQPASMEVTLPSANGPRVCEMRVVGMEWNGEHTRLASIRDVTERKQAEALRQRSAELELQNERIREASELKSTFVAHMSHEIRTPMNAVIGLTHLLGQSRLDDDQRQMITQLQSAGSTLMGLLNNVLDLSKIEAGQVALEDLPFEITPLVEDVAMLFAAQARQKGLTLSAQVAPELPRWIRGDPTRLRQILTNLVGNALKFTEHGSVTLVAGLDPRDPACIRLSVRDTGMGIDAAARRRLFMPFTQADASTTRRFGGTGLGLSIVKHIAELMGGGIDVSSEPGVGSEFVVTLPVRVDGAGEHGGVRLLALGFDVDSPLTDAAATLGWQMECLPRGACLETLRTRLIEGIVPDAVVVDPVMAHDIRELIANLDVDPGRLPPCLAIEVDHICAARLFNELNAARQVQGADPEALLDGTRLDAAGLRWLAGLRVLVVDDGAINLEVARRLLERQGAHAETCDAATLALHRLDGAPTGFDAVLMDVQMPGMDGNGAVRRLRADARFEGLPVIALSAGTLAAERQRALEAGMDDFLAKPLDPPALARTLRRHVASSQGCAPVVAECQEVRDHTQWPPIEALDTSSIVERFGHDRHFYARMMRHLLDEYGEMGRTAPAVPLDKASRSLMRARMHKLRGSAGALGAPEIQQLAATLEARLTVDDGGLGLEALLTRLSTAIGVLESSFEAWAASLPPPDAPITESQVPPDEAVTRLRLLLQDQDMEAVGWVRQCAKGLRGVLGATGHEEVAACVERLDFRRALELLDGSEQPRAVAVAHSA